MESEKEQYWNALRELQDRYQELEGRVSYLEGMYMDDLPLADEDEEVFGAEIGDKDWKGGSEAIGEYDCDERGKA